MAHSVFGWSYPPGCSGPPEYEEEPCALCGRLPDDCICLECDIVVDVDCDNKDIICGITGCLEHINNGRLVVLIELRDCQLRQLRDEAKRRETTTPPCPVCGKTQQITINQDWEPYCCKHTYSTKHGWIKEEY